jgi:hypothetical protein
MATNSATTHEPRPAGRSWLVRSVRPALTPACAACECCYQSLRAGSHREPPPGRQTGSAAGQRLQRRTPKADRTTYALVPAWTVKSAIATGGTSLWDGCRSGTERTHGSKTYAQGLGGNRCLARHLGTRALLWLALGAAETSGPGDVSCNPSIETCNFRALV